MSRDPDIDAIVASHPEVAEWLDLDYRVRLERAERFAELCGVHGYAIWAIDVLGVVDGRVSDYVESMQCCDSSWTDWNQVLDKGRENALWFISRLQDHSRPGWRFVLEFVLYSESEGSRRENVEP